MAAPLAYILQEHRILVSALLHLVLLPGGYRGCIESDTGDV